MHHAWKKNGRELFLGGKTMGGNNSLVSKIMGGNISGMENPVEELEATPRSLYQPETQLVSDEEIDKLFNILKEVDILSPVEVFHVYIPLSVAGMSRTTRCYLFQNVVFVTFAPLICAPSRYM